MLLSIGEAAIPAGGSLWRFLRSRRSLFRDSFNFGAGILRIWYRMFRCSGFSWSLLDGSITMTAAKRIFFLIGSFLPIFIAILWRSRLLHTYSLHRSFVRTTVSKKVHRSNRCRKVVFWRSVDVVLEVDLLCTGLLEVEIWSSLVCIQSNLAWSESRGWGLLSSSFGSDAKGAWNTLHSILEKAEKELSLPNVIPVYLYATGGFRKLSEDKRTTLANQVCQLSSNSSSIMRLELDRWMVLSGIYVLWILRIGSDEAYYGWLAVNYLVLL